jgi:hypothetical protein
VTKQGHGTASTINDDEAFYALAFLLRLARQLGYTDKRLEADSVDEQTKTFTDIHRTFSAERRNLLLTSVALFLVEYSDLRFTQISVLGNVAELNNPNVLRFLGWVFWFYFSWRYYQHYREVRDTTMGDSFREKLRAFLLPIAHERYKQSFKPSSNYRSDLLAPSVSKPVDVHEFRFAPATWNFRKPWRVTVNLHGRVTYKLEDDAFTLDERAHEIELRWRDLLWPQLKAASFVLTNVSQFTEYYLPFAIASLPFIYLLIKMGRTGWNWLASGF